MMNCRRCKNYAHCKLRGDREAVPYCEEYRRPRYIRDSPDGRLPFEESLALATKNNGQFEANIIIRTKRSCIM
jgi:hypothetical protein